MEMFHSCYDWPLIGRNARQDYRLVGEAHVNRALDGEIITNLQKDASGADVSLCLNRWRRARQALTECKNRLGTVPLTVWSSVVSHEDHR
jgi:hypothetical protein